jgi:phosphoglycolate phosphatase
MGYKLVIFDFDGTLADTFPWFTRVLNTVADRYGFKQIQAHETEHLRGLSAREIIKHLGVPTWKLPLIARHMRALAAQDSGRIGLFDGVEHMLKSLSEAGLHVAVVNSNSEENVRNVLGPQLASKVTYYACGASMFGKRAKFRRVLKRSGVPRSEAICIGDEIRDHEAARAVGLAFGAVSWGYNDQDALRRLRPEVFFESPDQIIVTLVPETVTGSAGALGYDGKSYSA